VSAMTHPLSPTLALAPPRMPGMHANPLFVALRRDLLLAARRRSEVVTALFFFVVVVSLFPLAIGPEPALLRRIGPGVLWVAALLATLLGLPRLFAADHADGTLEQLALSPQAFGLLVAGKIAAHWLLCGLPLVLLAPLLGVQFGLPADALGVLMLSLLIGTPLLSLIGAIGAALTLGLRGGGALLSLLVLPLFVPALVFGAGAVEAHGAGLGAQGQLSLLGAMLALAAFFAPWATTAALRIALE
jgi:heme exporter protein B